ncbi:hypothetical protein CONLIGDRAFT_685772 [Coniochaeta ligniaria NRRL 30616]|uniref:Uncharacterized protein n=1 Tax=Coniochaeta ligniaria NRRL 30616 TaxID=1408157 RepID=A0A1J7J4S2_9PEZI|nr:hypothetical protein CONLIGDRAFT_685772 [Coniochaeta ligniaria NRRL 30616]
MEGPATGNLQSINAAITPMKDILALRDATFMTETEGVEHVFEADNNIAVSGLQPPSRQSNDGQDDIVVPDTQEAILAILKEGKNKGVPDNLRGPEVNTHERATMAGNAMDKGKQYRRIPYHSTHGGRQRRTPDGKTGGHQRGDPDSDGSWRGRSGQVTLTKTMM